MSSRTSPQTGVAIRSLRAKGTRKALPCRDADCHVGLRPPRNDRRRNVIARAVRPVAIRPLCHCEAPQGLWQSVIPLVGMTGKTTIYNVKNRMPILLALKE